MRAIRVHRTGGPEVLQLEEVADPAPGAGQLLIGVRAVGVNPVETYKRAGAYARLPDLPYTPGSDAAGEVLEVGEGVRAFRVGDRVYTDNRAAGAYAERMVCDEAHAHPLPDGVGFAQGASLGVPYATAYRALFQRGQAGPGEVVLVHGATGGVGLAAVQLARAAGLRVLGTGGTPEGREEVLRQGADHALDHHREGYLEAIPELTAGRGVDVVLEMLANVNLGRDLGVLARGGRVVVVGSRGTVEINPRDTMSRDADIRGMTLFNTPAGELAEIHAALFAGLASGALRPVIAEQLSLADAADAHRRVMEAPHRGKIVLVP